MRPLRIIKIPFSGGGLGKGTGSSEAPDKIVSFLKDICSGDGFALQDLDVSEIVVDENDIEMSHKNIKRYLSKINSKAILIGGDHSITFPAVQGFAENLGAFKLVVFDAHPDLMDDFDTPTHESYLRRLIDDGVVAPDDVILVGVRNQDRQESEYISSKRIRCFTSRQILEEGVGSVITRIIPLIDKPTYVSIDIDFVDAGEVTGTGYPESGGPSSRELIVFLRELMKTGNLMMADIVEVNPCRDKDGSTSRLAAYIVSELCNM